MRRLLTLVFVLTFGASFAQKIQVNESNENIGGASHNAIIVTIPGATLDEVEKAWKGKMKKMGGKFSKVKGEYFADDAKSKKMGDNSFDVYARAEKDGDDGVKLIVGIDLGGAFMSSSAHGDQFKIMKDDVYDFAVNTVKDIIGNQLKDQEKVLAKLQKEEKDLVKENEKLHKDIEDYKKKILEAEADIEDNDKNQGTKKEEIGVQEKVLKDVEEKLKGIK
jgi:hypothetical protein